MSAYEKLKETLSEAELRVLAAAESGETVAFAAEPNEDKSPKAGKSWGLHRTVRADRLVRILTQPIDIRRPVLKGLRINGARVTGPLDLEGATLHCPLLMRGCSFEGLVNLREASAPRISLSGSYVPHLRADQLKTRGNLDLDGGFETDEQVDLAAAHIGGRLVLAGVFRTTTGVAVLGEGVEVDQDVTLRARFEGQVNLVGAHVRGQLICDGGTFRNPGGVAIAADSMRVDQDVFFKEQFESDGEVRFSGVHIGGQVVAEAAVFRNVGAVAFHGDGLIVEQAVFLEGEFLGEVRLVGASTKSQLVCNGTFKNPNGEAIAADGVQVDLGVFLHSQFESEGAVSLRSAQIRRQLACDGATLLNSKGLALDLEGVTINGLLRVLPHQFDGGLDLTDAHVTRYLDSNQTWPAAGSLWINRFSYEAIDSKPSVSVADRIAWIERNAGGYLPQPYDQLGAAYRRAGDDARATEVGIAKLRHRRSRLSPLARLQDVFIDVLVGYGYRTGRAALWLAGLLAIGALTLDRAHSEGLITPSDPKNPADFNALTYAIDWIVPIFSLHQREVWITHGIAQFLVLLFATTGWILTTAVVLGISGVLKRT